MLMLPMLMWLSAGLGRHFSLRVLARLHLAAQQEISGVTAKDIVTCSEIYEQL